MEECRCAVLIFRPTNRLQCGQLNLGNEIMRESRSTRMRFGMAALLLGVGFLATLFAGFRVGYQRGYSSGQEQWRSEAVAPMTYNVADLLDDHEDVDSLKNSLMATIAVESWSEVGGPGSIVAVGTDQLLVSQTPSVHKKIAETLQSLRTGRRNRNAK
jgi:hypothetical protein